jgi:uncharacterized membrane protein
MEIYFISLHSIQLCSIPLHIIQLRLIIFYQFKYNLRIAKSCPNYNLYLFDLISTIIIMNLFCNITKEVQLAGQYF